MLTGRSQLSVLTVLVLVAVMLSGCGGSGGSGRSVGATADPAPMPPIDEDAAMALAGLLNDSNFPAIVRAGAKLPPPDAVTCQALTIGCEGGLGPIHYGSVGEYDFSGFNYRERRRGVSLAESTADHRVLAGWMSHSFFLMETPTSRETRPYTYDGYYRAYSIGSATDSHPDVLVGSTATWSGVMFGSRISDPDVFVHGDALITVSNPDGDPDLLVDVEFSDIKDEDTGAELDNVSWNGLELQDGAFGVVPVGEDELDASRYPASEGISGRFYGPNHEEVGGLFSFTNSVAGAGGVGGDRYGVSGVFGAKRD